MMTIIGKVYNLINKRTVRILINKIVKDRKYKIQFVKKQFVTCHYRCLFINIANIVVVKFIRRYTSRKSSEVLDILR